jgi:hypothetical protein
MLKKLTLASLVILIILSLCIPAAAASSNSSSDVMKPMWTYLQLVHNGLDIDTSTGQASMISEMYCYTGTINKVRMDNYLQRYINGAWTTLKSWSQTTNDDNGYWGTTYYVYQGYDYRLQTYFYAYSGNTLLESTSLTTGIKYY